MNRIVLSLIVVTFVLVNSIASAQEPTEQTSTSVTITTNSNSTGNNAAVRIADAIQPDKVLADPIQCMEKMVPLYANVKDGVEKAAKYCTNAYTNGGKIMKGVGNEAADASKNNWPKTVILDDNINNRRHGQRYINNDDSQMGSWGRRR